MSEVDAVTKDLAASGLVFNDVLPGLLDDQVRNACSIPGSASGYSIPYFDIFGKRLQFYRCKLFNHDPKYKQPKNNPNHVYYPPTFMEIFRKVEGRFILLMEGEKKAALACKLGLPAVAFGGVDSWSNRILIVPKEAEQSSAGKGNVALKLPSVNINEAAMSTLATGFQELVDLGLRNKTTFIVCYDTDTPVGVTSQVQRAAARLGYELRFKGFSIAQIRQIVLPWISGLDKVSFDAYIMHKEGGAAKFLELVEDCFKRHSAFPRHPNVREHVNKQLQKPKLDRKQIMNLSLSIITELDAVGQRMYSVDEKQMYYFHGTTRHLMKVGIADGDNLGIQEQAFGKMLYRDFGIAPSADDRLMKWIGAQFAGEDPVIEVAPHKIVARPKDGDTSIRIQINNGQYLKISSDIREPFRICANGYDNVLFESDQVEPIDAQDLKKELERQLKEPVRNWWNKVLSEVRLKYQGRQAQLVSLLYYISPFLHRWKGTQLPIEIVTGESGSGKSTLMELRLGILTGIPMLRNAPATLKDWQASIAASGGLHVTDNVHMTDKNLKQQLSDELCRLVTEPNPHIEMRKYFTEADLRRIKIDSVFAFTAIQQPFTNGDVMQRSVILELEKELKARSGLDPDAFTFDAFWKQSKIDERGGRVAWIAHHAVVLHRFLDIASREWNHTYKAKHRLINLEQCLKIVSQVFHEDGRWITDQLFKSTNDQIERADMTLEGLTAWAKFMRINNATSRRFSANDIATWFDKNEEYEDSYQLTHARALGKYMQAHKHNLKTICGIEEAGKTANKLMYRIIESSVRDVKLVPDETRSMHPASPTED